MWNRKNKTVLSLIIVSMGWNGPAFSSSGHQEKHEEHHENQSEAHGATHEEHAKKDSHDEHHGSTESHGDSMHYSFSSFFHGVVTKFKQIKAAEEENETLKIENAKLSQELAVATFSCKESEAKKDNKELSVKLSELTGARIGRTLSSISYRIPPELNAEQLYTMGLSYFYSREDEKAAVILSHLTMGEQHSRFKSVENYLMAGISWYRIDNYDLAQDYFNHVLQFKSNDQNKPYHAQAYLWKALVERKMGQPEKSQGWLEKLVDAHPYSEESQWVNLEGKRRVPASDVHHKEKDKKHHD